MRASRKSFFKGFGACGPPANNFLKDLILAGSRNSLFKRFGISALGESHFPNGLELVVAKIWKLTVQRNGHVRLLGHYYNVPHTYMGKKESMRKRKTKESGKSFAM